MKEMKTGFPRTFITLIKFVLKYSVLYATHGWIGVNTYPKKSEMNIKTKSKSGMVLPVNWFQTSSQNRFLSNQSLFLFESRMSWILQERIKLQKRLFARKLMTSVKLRIHSIFEISLLIDTSHLKKICIINC